MSLNDHFAALPGTAALNHYSAAAHHHQGQRHHLKAEKTEEPETSDAAAKNGENGGEMDFQLMNNLRGIAVQQRVQHRGEKDARAKSVTKVEHTSSAAMYSIAGAAAAKHSEFSMQRSA